jgi:hypothetical protein
MLRQHWRWQSADGTSAFRHWRWMVNTSRRGLPPGAAATEGKRVITGQLPFATGLARLLLAIAAERRHGAREQEELLLDSSFLCLLLVCPAALLLREPDIRAPAATIYSRGVDVAHTESVRSN